MDEMGKTPEELLRWMMEVAAARDSGPKSRTVSLKFSANTLRMWVERARVALRLRAAQAKAVIPCVRECETCDGPLPPLDEWSMPSCPECVKLADERNELISELENISSYEAGAAQDIIKRAIAALRDDRTAPQPEVCRERTPCDGLVEIAETDAHVILQCPRCGGCVNVQKERIHEITKELGWRMSEPTTYFACGPSNAKCKCTCGVEGVPHVCEHQWDGWEEFRDPDGGGGGTAVCSRCGMTAMSHSMWVGP